ncbi:reverse transcriptase domain-containing protein [Tanacetum coccineum]
MTTDSIEELIAQRVADVLATYEYNRNTKNGDGNGSGTQSDGGSSSSRTMHTARGCTYKEFLNCQPLNFKGTKVALNGALTWWNSHVRTVGHDADVMEGFDENVTVAYCLKSEIQNLEHKLWNLTVKGTDVVGYTQRFQELALFCPRMVPEEEDKGKRYIWVLPNSIQENVTSSKPTRLQDAIQIANSLMD